MALGFGVLARGCRNAVFAFTCLLAGTSVQARLAMGPLHVRVLPSSSGLSMDLTVNERQVHDLIHAHPHAQERQLVELAQQISRAMNGAPSARVAYPVPVVQSWLRALLDRKTPQALWVSQVPLLAERYALLDGHLSGALGSRRDPGDLLVQVNRLRMAGRFAEADEVIHRLLQDGGTRPDRVFRRQQARLLMVAASLALVQMKEDLGARRVLQAVDLRDSDVDVELGSWLLIAAEAWISSGHHEPAMSALERLDEMARHALAQSPQFSEWNTLRWGGQALAGVIHEANKDTFKAMASYESAWELSEVPGALSVAPSALRLGQWAVLLRLMELNLLRDDLDATARYASLLKGKGQAAVDLEADQPLSWAMLWSGQLVSAEMRWAANDPVSTFPLYREAVRSAEKWVALDGGGTSSLEGLLSSLSRIVEMAASRSDWPEALDRSVAAVAVAQRLVALHPGDGNQAYQLEQAHIRWADALHSSGDTTGAVRALQAGMAIAQRYQGQSTPDVDWTHERWLLHATLGDRLGDMNDLSGAIAAYRISIEVAEQAPRDASVAQRWSRNFWHSQFNLGDVLSRQGDHRAALEATRLSLASIRPLAEGAQAGVEDRRSLFLSLFQMGDISESLGAHQEVLRYFSEGAAVARQLADMDPGEPYRQDDLWRVLTRVGRVQALQGNHAAAITSLSAARDSGQAMLERERHSEEWLTNTRQTLTDIGDSQEALKNLEGAVSSYREAAALAQRMVEQNPNHAAARRDLWLARHTIGRLLALQKRWAAATEELSVALNLVRALVKASPQDSAGRADLWYGQVELATAMKSRGDTEGAIRHFQEAVETAQWISRQAPDDAKWRVRLADTHMWLGDAQSLKGGPDAGRASMRASEVIQQEQAAIEYAENARVEALRQLTLVLDLIGLSITEATALSKPQLTELLQAGVDDWQTRAREQGITPEISNKLLRLQNALFAIRHRSD